MSFLINLQASLTTRQCQFIVLIAVVTYSRAPVLIHTQHGSESLRELIRCSLNAREFAIEAGSLKNFVQQCGLILLDKSSGVSVMSLRKVEDNRSKSEIYVYNNRIFSKEGTF